MTRYRVRVCAKRAGGEEGGTSSLPTLMVKVLAEGAETSGACATSAVHCNFFDAFRLFVDRGVPSLRVKLPRATELALPTLLRRQLATTSVTWRRPKLWLHCPHAACMASYLF